MAGAAREIARGIVDRDVWPTAEGPFVRVNGAPRDLERLVQSVAAALDRARAEALEEAARVAESHAALWRAGGRHFDGEMTANAIATRIRALRPAPPATP